MNGTNLNVCHDDKRGKYCVACCSLDEIDTETKDSYLENEILSNTQAFKGLTDEQKIRLGVERYYESRNDGSSSFCGNLIYLGKGKKAVGCAIHPTIVGEEKRPCSILIAYCNEYFKINANDKSQENHLKETKKMKWKEYSSKLKEKLNIFSFMLGYVKDKF